MSAFDQALTDISWAIAIGYAVGLGFVVLVVFIRKGGA